MAAGLSRANLFLFCLDECSAFEVKSPQRSKSFVYWREDLKRKAGPVAEICFEDDSPGLYKKTAIRKQRFIAHEKNEKYQRSIVFNSLGNLTSTVCV